MPSERLVSLLQTAGLAARADLEGCESLVRRLSGDLPDFDSVWLDALVQRRLLTPWQAECLQQEPPGRLKLGEYVLEQPLGPHTFLATRENGGGQFAIRRCEGTGAGTSATLRQRADEILKTLARSQSPVPRCLTLPRDVVQVADDQLWLVADYVAGWSLEELLIRGGRLPWRAVAEIGRELLDVLVWFESLSLQHGSLTVSSVRLCGSGRLAVVDALTRRISSVGSQAGLRLSLRDCEGRAPELVGTGRLPDSRSELYAVGCLLWQLLTSRPVVLTADPVRRMMSLREADVEDVRQYVPDCPEWMARSLQAMTRRIPELRPASAMEIQDLWQPEGDSGFRNLRLIAQAMPDRAERCVRNGSKGAVTERRPVRALAGWASAAVVLVAGGLWLQQSVRFSLPLPLSVARWSDWSRDRAAVPETPLADAVAPVSAAELPVPLPAPDAEGVIRLQAGRSYVAAELRFPGALRIVSEGEGPAQVLVPEGSQWILQSRSVELRGLSIRAGDKGQPVSKAAAGKSATQLIAVQCGTLSLDGCVVQSPSAADEFSGIGWYRPAGSEGIVLVSNSVFAGGGYGISFEHPPGRFELRNVLLANRGSGVLCEFSGEDRDAWSASLQNVTQRFGFSLMDVVVHESGPERLSLSITSEDCVYQPRMAVLRIRPVQEWKPESMLVRFAAGESGHPGIVRPAADAVVYVQRTLGQPVRLPESRLPDSMLLFVDATFADAEETSFSTPWAGSALVDFDGPKLSSQLPGIVVDQLPSVAE